MIELEYALYDAFSAEPFGGSPAALVADAGGLNAVQMQQIAREFAAPATGFICGFDGETVQVRFFSTRTEYPMCGHGSIALAAWMVDRGDIVLADGIERSIKLQTPGSLADLVVRLSAMGRPESMLSLVPANIAEFSGDRNTIARLLGSDTNQMMTTLPVAATSTDFHHLIVPMQRLEAVEQLQPNFTEMTTYCRNHQVDTIIAFSLETESADHTVHCREFAPAVGTEEVAATGTTNRALACYLHTYKAINTPDQGEVTVLSEQGYAMGRPSVIRSVLKLRNAEVTSVKVGGVATQVMQGKLNLDI